jgi:hypothetical protein
MQPFLRLRKSWKVLSEKNLKIWLGGRDSNPDTVVQSHVSYRWTTSQYQRGRARGAGNPDYSQSKSGPATQRARADTGTTRHRHAA